MQQDTIKMIFESVDGYLTLQKLDMTDENFIKLLNIKPSEINILLSRVASLIKGEEKEGQTKKDLINQILEVLERSSAARQFVGIGAMEQYKLVKGFPVRKGDPYEHMPEPNVEMMLKPSEVYISWTSDPVEAREMAIKYDASKGDPIGGLLVDVHVDVSKILFDVNAVVRTVKSKYALIQKYNQQAAPGKSLSKNITTYLATEAPQYKGAYEIISTNKVIAVRVVDKWVWDTNEGGKKIKWVGENKTQQSTPSAVTQQPSDEPTPAEPETPQIQPPQTTPPQQDKVIKERLRRLFEAEEHTFRTDEEKMPIYEEIIDEGVWQGMKNFIAKTAGTMRGKKMKYLQQLIKFYQTEKQVYSLAKEYASHIDTDQKRSEYAQAKMDNSDKKIEEIQLVLRDIEQGINVDDIPEVVGNNTSPMAGVDPNSATAKAAKDKAALLQPDPAKQQSKSDAQEIAALEDDPILNPFKKKVAE